MTVKELKRGEYFTLKPIAYPKDSQVYIRGEYDKSMQKFECGKFSDISESRYLRGDLEIFVDFVF